MQAAEKVHCPHCGNSDVYRIHRNWLVRKFSFLVPVRRYACYSCLHKFYTLERNHSNNHSVNHSAKSTQH